VKECPNCAVEIQKELNVCPICGYEFAGRPVFPWKPVAAVLIVVILFPLALALIRYLSR
jgi:RNA polymerase subunit RPABC4/transcription elongation factor Spt4